MNASDIEALVAWARSRPRGLDVPRGFAMLLESEANRALARKCRTETGLTLDMAHDLWVEKCLSRPWWKDWLVRTTLRVASTSEPVSELTRALRLRVFQDAEEVHRSSDPDYQWARQKLLIALRRACFERKQIQRVAWAAPPGEALLARPVAQPSELAELGPNGAERAPSGKQEAALWLVARWEAKLPKRAEVWRVAHVLKGIQDGVPIEEVDDSEWDAREIVDALERQFTRAELLDGLAERRGATWTRLSSAVMEHASDEADLLLKVEELRALLAKDGAQ